MKSLEVFSVRGLRFFESILLILGLSLMPLSLFSGSSFVKLLIGFIYVAVFAGFFVSEKTIGRKLRQKVESHNKQMNVVYLRTVCNNKLEQCKALSKQHSIHLKMNGVSVIEQMHIRYNQCETFEDYTLLKDHLTGLLFELLNQIEKKGKHSREYAHSSTKKETSSHIYSSPSSLIKQSLKALNLPENTKDFVQVKSAYKAMIKKHHPDINKNGDADNKTVELNLAMEVLKKHLDVS